MPNFMYGISQYEVDRWTILSLARLRDLGSETFADLQGVQAQVGVPSELRESQRRILTNRLKLVDTKPALKQILVKINTAGLRWLDLYESKHNTYMGEKSTMSLA